MAPAGACSNHRNPRREREGDVRCSLHLKRLGDVIRPLPGSCASCARAGGWSDKGFQCSVKEQWPPSCSPTSVSGTGGAQSLYPTTPASSVIVVSPRSLLPEWGTSHSCIGWRTEKPTDTDVNIQMQIQKQTQAPAPVSQSPEGCVSGEQREGASRGRQR